MYFLTAPSNAAIEVDDYLDEFRDDFQGAFEVYDEGTLDEFLEKYFAVTPGARAEWHRYLDNAAP